MQTSRLQDFQIFLCAAEAGSFTEAAKRLQLSPVLVSAAVKRLEESLQTRLFERSTRKLRLSVAGEQLLPHARQGMDHLLSGLQALKEAQSATRLSPIRLSMPSGLAHHSMLDWIEDFLAGRPADQAKLRIELRVSDRLVDLLKENIDLALRYGELDDSGFVGLPIAPQNRRVLCASPAYLRRYGQPKSLDDLTQHNCLRFVMGVAPYSRWRFERSPASDKPVTITVTGNRVSDDASIVKLWAMAGLGIAYKSQMEVADALADGRLQPVLPQMVGEAAPLSLVVVSRLHLDEVVRSLAQYLSQRCMSPHAL